MQPLGPVVELSVEIAARPSTVYRCVTQSDLLSRWLAATVTMDARVGGAVRIDFARYATVVEGVVVELVPDERIVFTWGVTSGAQAAEMPAGSTQVELSIAPCAAGSRVTLRHGGRPTEASRRDHAFGWTGYLGQLAQTAPRAQRHEGFEGLVDDWFAAWAEPDAAARGRLLARTVVPGATFRDVHAEVAGAEEIGRHIAACQAMFPGVRMVRDGAVMQTRSSLLAKWQALAPGGAVVASGVNHFRLAGGGEIEAVEGFWTS